MLKLLKRWFPRAFPAIHVIVHQGGHLNWRWTAYRMEDNGKEMCQSGPFGFANQYDARDQCERVLGSTHSINFDFVPMKHPLEKAP